jgi:hypothetical protein
MLPHQLKVLEAVTMATLRIGVPDWGCRVSRRARLKSGALVDEARL